MQNTSPVETVALKYPVVGHAPIREYKLRRPTAKDILPVGFPYSWQPTRDGGAVFVENQAAIEHYVERCVTSEDNLALFSQMHIEDTLELRDKIISFFREAEKTRNASETSSTGSSSNSDGGREKLME